MKQVWQTSDGKIFEDIDSAGTWETRLEKISMIEKFAYNEGVSFASAFDVAELLVDNREWLIDVLTY
jgi:hypothetical protein